MTVLDVFALIVLIVLVAAVVGIWVILGMMPGKIAAKRNHPQAEAINICGWLGVITMGILLPLAFIWAYTNPRGQPGIEKGESEIPATNNNEEVAV
jgi:amino acid transporter